MSILDRFRLDGKRLFITGGSRGLGREMAMAIADVGGGEGGRGQLHARHGGRLGTTRHHRQRHLPRRLHDRTQPALGRGEA